MASLYKKPVVLTDPETGERVKTKSKKWWGRFRDENGTEKRVPLAADKTAALAMLNELVKKMERQAAGVTDRYDEHRKRLISEHVTAFDKNLRAKEVSEEHAKLVVYRIKEIIKRSKAKRVDELTASRVQSCLSELRRSGNSIQTSNHYLRAIKQFTRWLVKDRRASEDLLAFIAMLNVATDRRHDRRPLTDDQFKMLINTAQNGPIVCRLSGEERAMLYTVAAFTGLRASELASLTVESFSLDVIPATVKVQAGYSKRRRLDVIPLHASLVARLRPWLATKPARSLLWPGTWAKHKCGGKMLKADLEAAGIPYVDEDGLFADFHSLRHTFITNMVKSGVNPKVAQTLARHSTIELTMNVYTSLTINDQATALASIPPVPELDSSAVVAVTPRAAGKSGRKKVPTVVPRGAKPGAIRLASNEYQSASVGTESEPDRAAEPIPKNAKFPRESGISVAVRTNLHRSASSR
jgi:integrase